MKDEETAKKDEEKADATKADEKDEKREVKEKDENKTMDIDEEELDVFMIQDINDIGNGKPLFMNFVYEDWTLLSLRYELHLLVYAFKHDVSDPDRPGFHESHLSFYYNKYFKKAFNVKYFGVESFEELCGLVKDSVALNPSTKFVEAVMPESAPFDKFVRYTEDHRRERQRCIDAGDETALLKFMRPAPPPPRQAQGSGSQQQRGSGSGGYQRPGHSRPPPQSGRNGPARGGYGGSGGGSGGGGYPGPAPSRGSYGAPVGASQKRPYTPPPPSPYPPSKHQRSGYGSGPPRSGGSYSSSGAPPRSSYGGSGRSYR